MSFFRTFGFDAAVIGAVALIGTGATASAMLMPKTTAQTVAVVFAPWTSPQQALLDAAEAGGRVIGFGRLASIVIVAPDHHNYARDVAARGAWLVADAARARGCGVADTN